MKMTKLARFFRFCGFGVAVTTAMLGTALIIALSTMNIGGILPLVLGLIACCVLFIFAVSWIVLSYGLEREGARVDDLYDKALGELEAFRTESSQWYATHIPDALEKNEA